MTCFICLFNPKTCNFCLFKQKNASGFRRCSNITTALPNVLHTIKLNCDNKLLAITLFIDVMF